MKRLAQIACAFIALCGCCDKAREAHDDYLRCLEARLGHINLRAERNDCRQDIELREIRRHLGFTNDLPVFVAENGGGGPSPEFELTLEMIEDISRALDRTSHHLDTLSNRLDRLEQRLAGETNEVTVIVTP